MSDDNYYGRDGDGETWYVTPHGRLIQANSLELARERAEYGLNLTPAQVVHCNQICIESYGIKAAR